MAMLIAVIRTKLVMCEHLVIISFGQISKSAL